MIKKEHLVSDISKLKKVYNQSGWSADCQL